MLFGQELFLTSIVGAILKWGTIAWFVLIAVGIIHDYYTDNKPEPFHMMFGGILIWFFVVLVSVPVLLLTIVIDLVS